MLDQITPVILSFNEEANIARTLERLSWARDIVVVDSGSRDASRAIVGRYSNTRLYHRDFDSHARQWNFAIGKTRIHTDWILALDADHAPTDELLDELASLRAPAQICGYRIRFIYCMRGRRLHGSLYPPLVSLYRRGRGEYMQQGHTQRLRLRGRIDSLRGYMLHDDRKSLVQWFEAQRRYSKLEAALIRATPWRQLSPGNRLRRLILPAPFAALIWSLLIRGAILDGPAGLEYGLQRMFAETLVSFRLLLPRPRESRSASIPEPGAQC